MNPNRRDEGADAVRSTTRDVGAWLDRLEFPSAGPAGESPPARDMRQDLRVNFYDTVQHWLGDLRERLRTIETECDAETPVIEEHVAETMTRIIDAARDVAASSAPAPDQTDDGPGSEAEEEPAPEPPSSSRAPDAAGATGEVEETVASFREKLQAERQRLAERARRQRAAALGRLRRGCAADAPAEPSEAARTEATAPANPSGDGIRFRRVDL